MIYTATKLAGAFIIEPQPIRDDRGFFTYLLDAKEAAEHGLSVGCVQVKLSYNFKKGTLRGMHYQTEPATEVKLVRCTRGSVWDIIVDVRPGSPTYLQHIGVELSAENRKALYVPQMFAHGYQTLVDDSEVVYQVDEYYAPQTERGLRYDDPALQLQWPVPVTSVSKRDQAWALLGDDQ
jgi:dTDP-4-dehydrorhamnose 3,5-epimerase